jgi:hypothetical protein
MVTNYRSFCNWAHALFFAGELIVKQTTAIDLGSNGWERYKPSSLTPQA